MLHAVLMGHLPQANLATFLLPMSRTAAHLMSLARKYQRRHALDEVVEVQLVSSSPAGKAVKADAPPALVATSGTGIHPCAGMESYHT